MKKLIVLAVVSVVAANTGESFAQSCRISSGHHDTYPVGPPPNHCPPKHCYIRPAVPVCPPVHECTIAPPPVHHHRCEIRPVCPPPVTCTIRPCHVEPVCQIRPCEPVHHVCRIRVCEPVEPICRIHVCEPVYHVCRIRPCDAPLPSSAPAHPVSPQPAAELPEVQAGQEVTIDGQSFGEQPGMVAVQIGELQLQAQVTGWSGNQVRAVLPAIPLARSAQAVVAVMTAGGQIADQLDVLMVQNAQQQVALR